MTMHQRICTLPLFLFLFVACQTQKTAHADDDLFSKDNLIAWCVVPFDSVKRTPQQRAEMLRDLGFTKFAYDWRLEHLPTFPEEVQALKSAGIEMSAIWIWVEADSGKLWNETTERVLQLIEEQGVKTRLWVGYESGFFEGLPDDEKLTKAVESVSALRERAVRIGCTISLYNHGDWFGDPQNQIRIIQQSGKEDIGIVYNFHHAHEQLDSFPQLLQQMLPYLTTVNINGMKKDGPKILPVGSGDLEHSMLATLRESGYRGPVGILGHVENADVRLILEQNLQGLNQLVER